MTDPNQDSLLNQPQHTLAALKRYFGFESFQSGQAEVIDDILAGYPTIAIMPTGAGKSLCYQLPALMLEGITLVVSPLIALMKDQVDSLRERGTQAEFINSSQTKEAQNAVLKSMEAGETKLVYVAPERFRSARFMGALRRCKIELIAVDEAHCISRWGHDFRPEYGRLGQVISHIAPRHILACTATATGAVRQDIQYSLGMDGARIHVAGFLRQNLHLSSKRTRTDREREGEMLTFIAAMNGHEAAIVYATTRRRVERYANACSQRFGADSVVAYHAGMSDEVRNDAQNRFMDGRARIAVATNAFGMGIDRADIRGVIHMDLPRSIEGYYQEVGRAGRDGAPSQCLLLHNPVDRRTHEFLIDLSHPTHEWLQKTWQTLTSSPTGTTTITDVVSRYSGLKAGQVESALRVLSKIDAAYMTEDDQWVKNPHAPRDLHALGIDISAINERRQREMTRLDQITSFAYTTACRHGSILEYFGEQYGEETCPGCDRCDDDQNEYEPLSDENILSVRKALAGVARAEGQFGLTKIAGMLAGSKAKNIQSTHLPSLSTYGVLRDLGLSSVTELLQTLIDRGWCSTTSGQYPCLTISKAGWEIMQGRIKPTRVPSHWSKSPPPKTREPRPGTGTKRVRTAHDDSDIGPWWAALREFRAVEAARRSVPAYVVFSDKTLADIAEQKPRSMREFLEIRGLGSGRWDTYGEALVARIEELSAQIGE